MNPYVSLNSPNTMSMPSDLPAPLEHTLQSPPQPTLQITVRASAAEQVLLAALDASAKQLAETLEALAHDAVQKAFFEYQAHRRAIAEQLT